MLEPSVTTISCAEYEAAIDLLNVIMHTVGNVSSGEVLAINMHRLIAFLAGAVLETDTGLCSSTDFDRGAEYLGLIIAHHARAIRSGRTNGTPSPIDSALALDDCILMI